MPMPTRTLLRGISLSTEVLISP